MLAGVEVRGPGGDLGLQRLPVADAPTDQSLSRQRVLGLPEHEPLPHVLHRPYPTLVGVGERPVGLADPSAAARSGILACQAFSLLPSN